jgi:protein-S-isoprenylcysteine O-methyltransferase Ste14
MRPNGGIAMAAPATPQWYLKVPPPVWTLGLLLAAYLIERTFGWGRVIVLRSTPAAILFGAAGIVIAALAVSKFFTAGTEIEPASATNKKVVAGGPFRFTRNPMYLGLVLMSLGIALYMGTLPFFLVPLLVFLICDILFIPFEEAKMRRQHGDLYTEYTSRVRRWM